MKRVVRFFRYENTKSFIFLCIFIPMIALMGTFLFVLLGLKTDAFNGEAVTTEYMEERFLVNKNEYKLAYEEESEDLSLSVGVDMAELGNSIPKTAIYDEVPLPETSIWASGTPENVMPVISTSSLNKNYDIINDTKYEIDADLLRENASWAKNNDGEPLVLIYHTHGTESFFEDNGLLSQIGNGGDERITGYYKKGYHDNRSTDISKNVVAVGEKFAETLRENGINVIHCEEMFDLEDYKGAYARSLAAVKTYLEKYPSIKYVIDIHRDSIVLDNGENINPSFMYNGEKVSQVMVVAGTDAGGGYHPYWRDNLGFFLAYKSKTDESYPGMSRPIYLRKATFNQQVSRGAFILEIGSSASKIEEAFRAAHLSAQSLSDMINDK